MAYLMVAAKQYENKEFAGNYNVGPNEEDCISVGTLVEIFCKKWEKISGQKLIWSSHDMKGPHEANMLKLDCSKLKKAFDWKPVWNIEEAVEKSVEMYYSLQYEPQKVQEIVTKQINY